MLKKWFFRIIISIAGLAIVLFGAFKLSPYPSALIIRYVFNREAVKTNDALQKHVPSGVHEFLDIAYMEGDEDTKLDVYFPATVNDSTRLPLVVWIHGGGLISGNKGQVSNYCKILAAYGYVVVSVDYSIAPEARYPRPLIQTNAALAFLMENSEKWHINRNSIFIAGDSGGAQIAAQMGNMIYNSGYAGVLNMVPSINKNQLKGLILYCGIYNLEQADTEGEYGSFFKTVLWAYSGTKNFKDDAFFKTASVYQYITGDFPPGFISAGNGDPLLEQSRMLAEKLAGLNIGIDTLFFAPDRKPELPHEYQFNLNVEAGHIALYRSLKFMENRLMQEVP